MADTFEGGFVAYPDAREAAMDQGGDLVADYTARILWDWKEPQAVARPGFAKVKVRFKER